MYDINKRQVFYVVNTNQYRGFNNMSSYLNIVKIRRKKKISIIIQVSSLIHNRCACATQTNVHSLPRAGFDIFRGATLSFVNVPWISSMNLCLNHTRLPQVHLSSDLLLWKESPPPRTIWFLKKEAEREKIVHLVLDPFFL